jgi:multidrug efflux pump subunit AcrB
MFNLAARARPYLGAVVLTAALLTAGGIYSATRMASGIYPEVTFPRIAIVAHLPGQDVATMEVKVTRPIEQAVSTVPGAIRVRSKTIRGGSELSVDFDPATNMRYAKEDTWNKIGAVRGELPATIDLTIEQMTPSFFPILSVVLTGGDSASQLRDYAFYQLAPRIKNIPDVLYANVTGGDLREIEVEARPDALLAAGLSAADLADQIGKAHVLQPVGRIERPPLAYQILVNTYGQSAEQIADLVITTRNNQALRVRDLADVRVLHQDRVSSVGYAGKDAVVVTVFRRIGGNTVKVSDAVRELLVRQPPPRNIQAAVSYDQARFVNAAVDNVRDAILIGGLFSILILLAFLRSWRATLISALAIPTTLAITFLFLHWAGETLNLMSLGGLAVAIGLIIDDTVVVIENIARHLTPAGAKASGGSPAAKSGADTPSSGHPELSAQYAGLSTESSPADRWLQQTNPEAFRKYAPPSVADPVTAASGEITGAVVGSTLTTVLVFVPLAFIVGVYGQFFAALSWSLSIAVLVSMVISLTLVPVIAAKFLAGRPMPEPGRIYKAVAHLYELLLAGALRFPLPTLILAVAAAGLGVLLFTGIPDWRATREPGKPPPAPLVKGIQTGLMPAMDEGAFILDYWAPSGTSLGEAELKTKTIEHILWENPDVENYVRRTGSENGLFATQTNRGDVTIVLRPAEEDPISLLTKPVRPKFSEAEKELLAVGKERAAAKFGPKYTEVQMWEEGKAYIRQKYRRRSMTQVMEEVEDEVKEHFSEHQLKIEVIPIIQDELNDLSGSNRPIEVKLFGPEYATLRPLATEIAEKLEKNGKGRGLKEINSNVFAGNPDLMVKVHGVWSTRGLGAQEVQRQLNAMYLGQVATQVRESALRITDVRVRYPDSVRFGRGQFDPQQILEQWILLPENVAANSPAGLATVSPLEGPRRAMPLGGLATLVPLRTPDEQVRENQQPAVIITAEQNEAEAGLGAVVEDIRTWVNEVHIPAGYRWELGGHYLQQQQAFRSLTLVMVVAILLVFIMLAFQFRSIALPLLIFLTQPLSLVSGLFALWITNTPLNVSSYMGAILLIGLDMKNGILLVEYIQQLRAGGMALRPALLLAGRTRFRPILMTSLAAILGLFPLALGIGPGAQMQQPLAIMVIGGLTANMLFTRVVIPVGYLVMEQMGIQHSEAKAGV